MMKGGTEVRHTKRNNGNCTRLSLLVVENGTVTFPEVIQVNEEEKSGGREELL